MAWIIALIVVGLVSFGLGYVARDRGRRDGQSSELEALRAFHETILDANPSVIVVWDADTGHRIYANPALTTTLGFTPADMSALDRDEALSLVHPDDRLAERSAVDETIASGRPVDLTHRVRTKDEHWRWFATTYRSFPDPARPDARCVLASSTDVTDRIETERLQELILELTPAMTVVFDVARSETLYANAAFTHETGYLPAELNALPLDERRALTPAGDRAAVDDAIQRTLETGEITSVRRQYRNRDGTFRWYDTRFLRFPDPTGRHDRRILSTAVDITEHIDTEQLNGAILASSPISFLVYDVDARRYEWTNPAFAAATGFTGEQLNARRAQIGDGPVITHPDDIAEEAEAVESALATRRPVTIRNRLVCADGETRTFDTTIVPLPDPVSNRERRVLVASVDISDRLAAEGLSETILAASPAPTVVVDADTGTTIYANPAFTAATGHTPAALNSMVFEDMLTLTPDGERALVDRAIRRTLETGEVTSAERTYRSTDGTVRWYDSRFLRLPHAPGAQVVITAIDTTDRLTAERALEAERIRLERANQDLQDFVYVASHDLQEPLRSVSAFATLLEQELAADLTGDARTHLRFIGEGTRRMQEMVAGLLELSRMERHHEVAEVDLTTLVGQIEADLADQIAREEATIVVHSLPTVLGDRTSLRTLLQNLISNALKFRSSTRPPEVTIRAVDGPEDAWRLEVSDNGIGIKDEHRERIFTIFQRLHARDAYEGSGIGLAHCKRAVENHGGEIGVSSAEDSGSTFWFTLSRDGMA